MFPAAAHQTPLNLQTFQHGFIINPIGCISCPSLPALSPQAPLLPPPFQPLPSGPLRPPPSPLPSAPLSSGHLPSVPLQFLPSDFPSCQGPRVQCNKSLRMPCRAVRVAALYVREERERETGQRGTTPGRGIWRQFACNELPPPPPPGR